MLNFKIGLFVGASLGFVMLALVLNKKGEGK